MAFNNYEKMVEDYQKQLKAGLPDGMLPETIPADALSELTSRLPKSEVDPEQFAVHTSDNTVTMDGRPESLPHFSPPTDIVPNKEPVSEDIKQPDLPPEELGTTPTSVPAKNVAPKDETPVEKPLDTSALTAGQPDPIPERGKRNKLAILGSGIADAISAAAAPFGGNAPGGFMNREIERQDKDLDRQKLEAEDRIKSDPNSAVSKNYRQMVLQMVPDLAKSPDFANMSAKMIGDKLPMIDTMMKAQAQKDMKELGMKQLAAQKEANAMAHNDQIQGKYEKEGRDVILKQLSNRSGGLGLQDSKVNQAIDLRQMINQNYDPKTDTYNIPPALHSELVLGLARLISPNGQIGIQMEQELKTKTAKEGLAKAFTYLTGVPVSGAPQDVIKMFVHSIDRQGETAEALRDKYNDQLRQLMPTQLNDEVKQKLMQQEMGSRFTDYKDPKKQKSKSGHPTPASKGNPLGLDL